MQVPAIFIFFGALFQYLYSDFRQITKAFFLSGIYILSKSPFLRLALYINIILAQLNYVFFPRLF